MVFGSVTLRCGDPVNHDRREGESCSPQGKQEGQERILGSQYVRGPVSFL